MAIDALTTLNTAVWDPKYPSVLAGESVVGASCYLPCAAEIADCTCPDFCERDHANE